MMTKYTMAFLTVGLVIGVLLTPARRYLRTPWLWGGAALSLMLFLPNLVWQANGRELRQSWPEFWMSFRYFG